MTLHTPGRKPLLIGLVIVLLIVVLTAIWYFTMRPAHPTATGIVATQITIEETLDRHKIGFTSDVIAKLSQDETTGQYAVQGIRASKFYGSKGKFPYGVLASGDVKIQDQGSGTYLIEEPSVVLYYGNSPLLILTLSAQLTIDLETGATTFEPLPSVVESAPPEFEDLLDGLT